MNARIKKKQIKIKAKTSQLKAIQEQQALSRYVKSVNPASFTTDKQAARFNALRIKVNKNGSVSMPKFDEWDDDYDPTLTGSIMKQYYDYVDKGWIRTDIRELDKYEAAKWFSENIMSEKQMKAAIKQADKWRASRPTPEEKFGSYNLGF